MIEKAQASGKGLYILLATVTSLVALAFLVPPSKEAALRVAFIGNSVTFVNDLPRFVEALGGNRNIVQDSCLHGALNFMSMLYKGNGMYNKWKTARALIQGDKGSGAIYDFGACSVPQLLLGHDEEFYYENSGKYSDGRNPCTLDSRYLAYRKSLYKSGDTLTWDYVVMNDQSRYPLLYERRKHSLMALHNVYAPLLTNAQATAVFLVTYGYVAQTPNVDDDASAWNFSPTQTEDDMPYFTSALYYGYQEYQQALEERGVPVRLAQVGLAFLTVWEENRELWRRLFFFDGLHPSPLGTYLQGCVVYATIRRRMPPASIRIGQVSQLWRRARRMHLGRKHYLAYITEDEAADLIPMDLPTRDEARYLSSVCRRVALRDYHPSSLLQFDELDEDFYSNYPYEEDESYFEQFDDGDYDNWEDDEVQDASYMYGNDDDDGWFWWN